MIHQVKERTGKDPGKGKPANSLIAKCGYTVRLAASDPQPSEFSAWTSDVTCKECA